MPDRPELTVTVIPGERFTRSGDMPEFRQDLDLIVMDSGLTAATIYAALWHRGVKVAEFNTWEGGGVGLASTASLNTTALGAVFNGRAPAAIVNLELRIHHTTEDGDLIASGKIPCRNNPEEGFEPPSDLDAPDYMRKDEYDTNKDGVVDDEALPPDHGGSGAAITRDRWTLTALNCADKYVALTKLPDLRMAQLTIENGTAPTYAEDFILLADPRRLVWDGLGLDGLLAEGDVLVLEYTYTPEE